MKSEDVRAFYEKGSVVDHYFRATNNVGLWESEKIMFERYFRKDAKLLELGCGTGRIALGLWYLGWKNISALDFSQKMIDEAIEIGSSLSVDIKFIRGDALELPFSDDSFDGAIFGFNGLMQNPLAERRKRILSEIRRVVKRGSMLVFTTHDRDHPAHKKFWEEETLRWENGTQSSLHKEFGDRCEESKYGISFIHVPDRAEVLSLLEDSGWYYITDDLRSKIASENEHVREFSDDCRFWVVQK